MLNLYSVCGEWKLSEITQWKFLLDSDKGASLFEIDEDVKFKDLLDMVIEDFGIEDREVRLSYELPLRLKVFIQDSPPVFIRNDRQLKYFINKLKEDPESIRLFVTVCDKDKFLSHENVCSINQSVPLIVEHSRHIDGFDSHRNQPLLGVDNISSTHQSGTHSIHGDHINVPLLGVDNISSTHQSGTHSIHGDHINVPLCSFLRADREECSSVLNPIPDLPPVRVGSSHSSGVKDDIYVNKHFKNKKEMMDMLRKWALQRKFEFKSLWSNTTRVILGCVDDKCSWRLRALVVPHSEFFVVKKLVDQHTCDTTHRNPNHRQATASTLASLICSGYHEKKDGLKAKQIVDLVRMNHGVQIKYKKAWRTKEIAETLVRGTPEDSYRNIAKWLFKVQEKNIGSKVFLEMDTGPKFKYAFLALGQSLRGFQHMRRVIAIDGTFLKSKYKGILLGASAQDGDFHIYPLAFGIVDSENEDSWTWFLRGLKTVIPDAEDLVFVSDRAQSIASSLSTVYPLAHHGICRVHFLKNVKSQFGKKGLIESVSAAANAYTCFEFHETFSIIKINNPKLATYLEEADFAKWARCYAPANRYNLMTTNIAESLNSLLTVPREMPVVSLLETIRLTLSKWFYERREKASRFDKFATPNITDIIAGRFDDAMVLDVYQVDEFEFEVKDDTHKYVVHLQNKHCTCNVFDIDRIPCIHAIAAAKRSRINEYKLVDHFYTKETWVKAYSESIHPCGDLSTCSYPEVLTDWFCGPPTTKVSSGRPPKKRKRSAGEFGVPGSKSQGHKCSRCGIGGHNKSTCRNRI